VVVEPSVVVEAWLVVEAPVVVVPSVSEVPQATNVNAKTITMTRKGLGMRLFTSDLRANSDQLEESFPKGQLIDHTYYLIFYIV
jgi:hypothetical protein